MDWNVCRAVLYRSCKMVIWTNFRLEGGSCWRRALWTIFVHIHDICPIDGAHIIFSIFSLLLSMSIYLCVRDRQKFRIRLPAWHKAPTRWQRIYSKKSKKLFTVLCWLKTQTPRTNDPNYIKISATTYKEQEHFNTQSPVASLIYGTCLSCPPLRHVLSANLEA
jgi:hypothetical protein